MKTSDFVLTSDFTWWVGENYSALDARTLPQGSFVRPLELHYVPKHCLAERENSFWTHVPDSWGGQKIRKSFDPLTEVFCYTRYGIITIPRQFIRVG